MADIYFHAIQVRSHAPVSFEMLVASLGVFKYNPIISNEELETIKSISKVEMMPMYPVELLFGSQRSLEQTEVNNNKFENLLVISEDEQQVYLAPSCGTSFVESSKGEERKVGMSEREVTSSAA